MNDQEFWDIIAEARRSSTDCQATTMKLKALLGKMPAAQIFAFADALDGKIADLYRWDVWGIAYLVNGGCSDDGFEYFRRWVVAQGKEFYERLANDPDGTFDDPDVTDVECEDLTYVTSEAYEVAAKQEMPRFTRKHQADPAGESWDEDDLEGLFPRTFAIYG